VFSGSAAVGGLPAVRGAQQAISNGPTDSLGRRQLRNDELIPSLIRFDKKGEESPTVLLEIAQRHDVAALSSLLRPSGELLAGFSGVHNDRCSKGLWKHLQAVAQPPDVSVRVLLRHCDHLYPRVRLIVRMAGAR
jgi:hypothetical protein